MPDETVESQEIDGIQHQPTVNQRRHEPVAGRHQPGQAQNPAKPGKQHHAAPGDAVRDMMGGPPPQGDVPDAPATQVTATENDEDGEVTRVSQVANAVPGQPDGEVDTRFGYTGT